MFEKVNPAHPDKIADRIAGAIVDLAYNESANPKIAVEVLIGHGMCNIAAESSVHISATDILEAVSRIAGDVVVNYHEVAQDPILARNQANAVRCGDNGIFRGVPVTDEQRALAEIAREIFARYPETNCQGLFNQIHKKATKKCQKQILAPDTFADGLFAPA